MANIKLIVSKKVDEILTKVAKQKATSKSVIVSNLVEQTAIGQDDIKSIILHIPVELLTNNKEQLHDWLSGRAVGILKHFYPE